ncbi:MAG: 4a-hydroxytetrahydrobiopterin dehydratase [Planctomycetota bacterium]
MTVEPESLETKHCKPCEGGIAPLGETEIEGLLGEVPGWKLREDKAAIGRKINAGTFAKAISAVEKVAILAEEEQHHPDLHLTGYRHLNIVLTTHAIGGLSENDFILAAKINAALQP